jgi:hypothetical protein
MIPVPVGVRVWIATGHTDSYLEEKQFDFSRTHDLYKAIRYRPRHWPAFTLFLDDGRVCLERVGL